MTQTLTIENSHLAATIAAKGAELTSLTPAGGSDLMWSGDPAVWPWHAPNLFPLVGGLADDTLIHQGKRYQIKQHGFLRHSECAVIAEDPASCAFRLTDSAATREQYPFAFELTISYRLAEDRLEIGFQLRNPGPGPLYASIGAHPAFRWPLGDTAREDHVMLFEQDEPAPIRRLAGRLMDDTRFPTPIAGRVLHLEDHLFNNDAMIFDALVSRRVTYGAPGGPAVDLSFADFPQFGIWSKPGGAKFVCLEPWQGHASPAGFKGEFADKPGVIALEAGATRDWRYSIRALARMPDLPV